MADNVIDLRRLNTRWQVVGFIVMVPFAAAVLISAFRDDVDPGVRVVAGVLGGLVGFLLLLTVPALYTYRRPRKLVIDHDGIRLENGGRRAVFRLAWTEIAGAGLLVADRRRRRKQRHYVRFSELPPGMTTITVVLELLPADADAVRRHPELRRMWRLGHERCWPIVIGAFPGAPPPIGELVCRYRPQLWRGERSGSLRSLVSGPPGPRPPHR